MELTEALLGEKVWFIEENQIKSGFVAALIKRYKIGNLVIVDDFAKTPEDMSYTEEKRHITGIIYQTPQDAAHALGNVIAQGFCCGKKEYCRER